MQIAELNSATESRLHFRQREPRGRSGMRIAKSWYGLASRRILVFAAVVVLENQRVHSILEALSRLSLRVVATCYTGASEVEMEPSARTECCTRRLQVG